MTDLEKLAQEWLERYWGFKMKPGVGKRDLLPLLERARAAGRIEGLKYALNLIDARLHKAPLDIWVELRARIQELEGEK